MTWGLNRTSVLALVAAAGLAMGGWPLEAKAADLGGNCCADLEERVADLEATTARKGNRKVSLEISGQVNRAIVAWDDGKSSDAYIVDNENSNTRFRMKGAGQFGDGWKGGFLIELGVNDTNSANVSQWDDEGRSTALAVSPNNGEDFGQINVRQANVFMESAKFGRVTIGQGSGATDDLGYINLGGSLSDAGQYYNNSYTVRETNAYRGGVTWGVLAGSTSLFDSPRGDYVRYDTPSLYGFILSAAWGENDVWDIALRYQKEWNSFRVAAGVGYYYNGDVNPDWRNQSTAFIAYSLANAPATKYDKIVGSASVMHVPTGLYASGAAVSRTLHNQPNSTNTAVYGKDFESTAWYIQGGISKRILEVGATTLYGEYANYDDVGAGFAYTDNSAATRYIRSSNVDRYGFGATQAFDGAGLEVYLQYHHYSADVVLMDTRGATLAAAAQPKLEDWEAVVSGMKLKF
jgi:hypothetical protein